MNVKEIGYDRKVLVEILVYHWRTDTAGCGCGWAELGKSHSEHVANVYEASVVEGTDPSDWWKAKRDTDEATFVSPEMFDQLAEQGEGPR